MSETWVGPFLIEPALDIKVALSDCVAEAGVFCFSPNEIIMSRRNFELWATEGMSKRQRRRWRGRLKGRIRLAEARGSEMA